MATVSVGSGLYDRKKAFLKTIQLRRGNFKWVRGSGSGGHQENANIKRFKMTNGSPITAGFRRKRKYTLTDSGRSRSKREKGEVQGSSILKNVIIYTKAIEKRSLGKKGS